jgi:hydroxymethylpyrimidine pyrophosphatase-like HAD family hydrolase
MFDDKRLALLRDFVARGDFARRGAVMTDLDGTAVHEFEGRIVIPEAVSGALTRLHAQGCHVLLNTLRFPLNVIRTFGREWHSITNAPLPLVSLNGAIIGHLREHEDGDIVFEELDAVELDHGDIDEVLEGVQGLVAGGVTDLALFHYPRDWQEGELIWTPDPARVDELRDRYISASEVWTGNVEALRARLKASPLCMIFLLVNAEEGQLMAYQHAKRSSFVTAKGVDKRSGAERLAAMLGIDLAHCIGAGDTPVDVFLGAVGLAVLVGTMDLEHKGVHGSIRVADSHELGALLDRVADLRAGLVGARP